MSLAQRAAPHLNWRILQRHFVLHNIILGGATFIFSDQCQTIILHQTAACFEALWIDLLNQLSQLGLGFQGFPDGHVFTMTLSVAGAVLKLQLEVAVSHFGFIEKPLKRESQGWSGWHQMRSPKGLANNFHLQCCLPFFKSNQQRPQRTETRTREVSTQFNSLSSPQNK